VIMGNWDATEGQQGLDIATETEQHFWTDSDGAHISSTGDHDTSGFHQLLTSVKNAFMHGTTELATFGEDLIELGKNSKNAVIKMCAGTFSITKTTGSGVGDYASIKSDSQMILSVPAGDPIVLTTYDTSGQTSDNGIGMNGNDAVIHCANVETNSKTIPASTFETALMPDVLYNGGAALAYSTAPGSGGQGTITASANLTTYRKIRVIFKTDDNAWDSATIDFPTSGKLVDLGTNHPSGSGQASATYVKSASYSVSGSSLVRASYCNMGVHTSGNAVASGDPITVMRIEGEK
jgi:hypothetical protein